MKMAERSDIRILLKGSDEIISDAIRQNYNLCSNQQIVEQRLLPEELDDPFYNNPGFTDDGNIIYGGDMILDDYQLSFRSGCTDCEYKAIEDEKYRWPNGELLYIILESTSYLTNLIESAMLVWKNATCVTFTEVDQTESKPHVRFYNGTGCSSNVGMRYNENWQNLSLAPGCGKVGTIMHEIGHALGLYHEHVRPDRDEYVHIHERNVVAEHMKNYNLTLENINTFGLPYDMMSVMHYPRWGFSKNGENTITTHDPFWNFRIGQRERLSFQDRKVMNLMYKCEDLCSSKPKCENGGFVTKECQCACPDEFDGSTCESKKAEEKQEFCGETHTEGSVPITLGPGLECVWVFKALKETERVHISFTKFAFKERNASNCDIHNNLEIRHPGGDEGEYYCGSELMGKAIIAEEITLLATTMRCSDCDGITLQAVIGTFQEIVLIDESVTEDLFMNTLPLPKYL